MVVRSNEEWDSLFDRFTHLENVYGTIAPRVGGAENQIGIMKQKLEALENRMNQDLQRAQSDSHVPSLPEPSRPTVDATQALQTQMGGAAGGNTRRPSRSRDLYC